MPVPALSRVRAGEGRGSPGRVARRNG